MKGGNIFIDLKMCVTIIINNRDTVGMILNALCKTVELIGTIYQIRNGIITLLRVRPVQREITSTERVSLTLGLNRHHSPVIKVKEVEFD